MVSAGGSFKHLGVASHGCCLRTLTVAVSLPSRGYPMMRGLMGALRLLEAAPFGPDSINVLKQAFEEAWASIGSTIAPTSRISVKEHARTPTLALRAWPGDRPFYGRVISVGWLMSMASFSLRTCWPGGSPTTKR